MKQFLLLAALAIAANANRMANSDGVCLKDETLGGRRGNEYLCLEPDLQLCCQKDDEFTCCEAEEEKTVKDQLMLWAFVALTVLAFGLVVCLLTAQGDLWESDTIRLAAINTANKLGCKKLGEKLKSQKMMDKEEREKNKDRNADTQLQSMPLAWF